MNWKKLETVEQLGRLHTESNEGSVVIFKHSSRCAVSHTVLSRLERNWKSDETGNTKFYFLDLLRYRDLSNRVAEIFSVEHESPQILVIKKGVSVYDRSHTDIRYDDLIPVLVKS